jgi:glyceraldehyde-3-phosphate dehydrogenase (NAD(P))
MKAKVLIAGYGVVGKRVADAVNLQDDMLLSGVVDVAATSLVEVAATRGYDIYAATDEGYAQMKEIGIPVVGDFKSVLEKSDIVVDTAPAGVTKRNILIYEDCNKKYIVNGGEKHELTGFSFGSLANYREAIGKQKTRVVSCNTTSLVRVVVALKRAGKINNIFVTVVRRGADPVRTNAGPINALVPVLGGFSHHAPDVNTVIPDVNITSLAVKTSCTLSHVHMLRIEFENEINEDDLKEAFIKTPRIIFVSGKKGISDNAKVIELFRDKLRPRNDMWEVAIWEDSIKTVGNVAVLIYCVHMEAVAVPENIDAIRAMLGIEKNPSVAIKKTDLSLGIYQEEADYEL